MTDEQTTLREAAAAISAAAEAAGATAELIRFAREGDALPSMAFSVEVAAHLAAALKVTLEIELPRIEGREIVTPSAERETAEQLLAALNAFQQVWA